MAAWDKEGGEVNLEDTHLEARGEVSVEMLAKRLVKDEKLWKAKISSLSKQVQEMELAVKSKEGAPGDDEGDEDKGQQVNEQVRSEGRGQQGDEGIHALECDSNGQGGYMWFQIDTDTKIGACVVDSLPLDRQNLEDAKQYYASATEVSTSANNKHRIPSWANQQCPSKHCSASYATCGRCWHQFEQMSARFSKSDDEEEITQLEMLLATEMRERYKLTPDRKDWKQPTPVCDHMCHLRRCFSCDHVEKIGILRKKQLGVLSGKQTLMDDHLVLSAQNLKKVAQQPFSDELLQAAPSSKGAPSPSDDSSAAPSFGFDGHLPASPLHNGTHFLLFYHNSAHDTRQLVRASSNDGVAWQQERIWTLEELGKGVGSDGEPFEFEVVEGLDFSILLDQHEPDPRFRYKMVLSTQACAHETYPGYLFSPTLYTSADGFEWRHSGLCFPGFSDTIPAIHHDHAGSEYDVITRNQWYV
jgi:hypothetical protein